MSGTVAEGLSAVAIRRASPAAIPSGPVVLTLGPDDQPRALTPALVDYVNRLNAGGTGPLPVPVLAIAAAVRARRRGSPAPEPRTTLRARSGEWLVLAGAPLAGGHGELSLSTYTVQDHLTSVFDKAGVRSRRQLVASLFFEHYVHRLGQPLNHRGWFTTPPDPEAGPSTAL